MPNYEIRKYFVALIKRIVLFSITLFFIITLLISATKSYAIPYPAGAGKGTLDCEQFINTTNEIDEVGELSGRSYIYRIEYVQWAYGFFTAFNIRHFEKTNTFKDLRPVADKEVSYDVIYDKLLSACKEIKNEEESNFAMAVYIIFSKLPGEDKSI